MQYQMWEVFIPKTLMHDEQLHTALGRCSTVLWSLSNTYDSPGHGDYRVALVVGSERELRDVWEAAGVIVRRVPGEVWV